MQHKDWFTKEYHIEIVVTVMVISNKKKVLDIDINVEDDEDKDTFIDNRLRRDLIHRIVPIMYMMKSPVVNGYIVFRKKAEHFYLIARSAKSLFLLRNPAHNIKVTY